MIIVLFESFHLCSVVFSVLNLQRSEEYWGPDAHVYDPDRWLDERLQKYTSNPFIFVPFNAGPRIVRRLHLGITN